MAHLCLSDVSVHFGGLQALSEVSFDLRPGEILSLIGPNGAGKTTIFNVITGVYRISGGSVTYDGVSISGLRPHRILARGIARTFQNIRLFTAMASQGLMDAHPWFGLTFALILAMEDSAAALRENADIRKAYLGQ